MTASARASGEHRASLPRAHFPWKWMHPFLPLLLSLFPALASAANLTEVFNFGSNPGNVRMFKYVPANMPSNAPLLVMMHGCTHGAADEDDEPGWIKYADLWKFYVVFPQQQSANNSGSCWNGFESADNERGQGEALSIKQMVDKMKADHSINASRVVAAGGSAGGGMTNVMLATYPDVFTGGIVFAAIPYKCGNGALDTFPCSSSGKNKTPQQWGDLVRAQNPGYSGPWPKVSLWHGSRDGSVAPANLQEEMEQWTNVHGVDQTPEVQDTIKGYPHKAYKTSAGIAVVETFSITNMDHGIPIDPGTATDQCGTAAPYILDVNICGAYFGLTFVGLNGTDSQAPTVDITSPSNGANVSGTVTIQAAAGDNIAVTRVEFFVDGSLLATDTSQPYSASWNTGSATNGSHNLQAKAFDAAGNTGSSAQISVNVSNGSSDTTPPTTNLTFPTNGSVVSGTVTLSAEASDDTRVDRVEFFIDSVSIGNGTSSGPAGPWTLEWITTSVADGSHTIMVKAYDPAGNVGTDNDTTVTVSQPATNLDETFSDKNANGDAPDNTGWTLGGYEEHADTHSQPPTGASESMFGYASSGVGCQTGLRTETLSRSVTLGSQPKLSYWRKLDLNAPGVSGKTAHFKVKVNGTVVDQIVINSPATHVESSWTERTQLSLSSWANTTVTLAFEAGANSNSCIEAWGKAWVDDIRVSPGEEASDTTPPTVNITAPANAATVSGTLDITVSATDNVAVKKVEFFVDGTLLGTDTTSPFAQTWDTRNVANGSHRLMAKSYDAAGNSASDDDTSVTVNNGGGGPVTVTYNNVGGNEDGYTKANSDGSGAVVGTGESLYGLGLGKGSDGKHGRAHVSFDTSAIPDTATINRVYLTVKYNSGGGDPWADPAGNTLTIDVKNGCLGSTCNVEAADWAATPTASAVANIPKWTSGTTNSGDFNAGGLSAVNKTGKTQVRLRFAQFNTAMNWLFIANGVDAKLTVEYTP